MPVYQSVCRECGVSADYLRPVSECMNTPECPTCGEKMKKVILSAPMGFVTGKFEPFKSSVDGSLITSQRELQQHNKRNGVVQMGEGYSTEELMTMKPPAQDNSDAKTIAADIAEATHMVAQGYKPLVEVHDD